MQGMPLESKIIKTQLRIREWYERFDGEVYMSFSGGLDSTVLLDIVRKMYPDTPAIFADTGLEYPEIRDFVKNFKNIEWLKPKKTFNRVIEEHGYPVVSKKVARFLKDLQNISDKNINTRNLRLTGLNQKGVFCPSQKLPKKWLYLIDAPFKISDYCCDVMKKEPFKRYVKQTGRMPMSGVMAAESDLREKEYLKHGGCNMFQLKNPMSMPLGFWTRQDALKYIKEFNIPYCSVYGDIIETEKGLDTTMEKRTGCIFCMFGVHMEKGENRFQRMKTTHPKLYNYCMDKLNLKEVLSYIGVDYK